MLVTDKANMTTKSLLTVRNNSSKKQNTYRDISVVFFLSYSGSEVEKEMGKVRGNFGRGEMIKTRESVERGVKRREKRVR